MPWGTELAIFPARVTGLNVPNKRVAATALGPRCTDNYVEGGASKSMRRRKQAGMGGVVSKLHFDAGSRRHRIGIDDVAQAAARYLNIPWTTAAAPSRRGRFITDDGRHPRGLGAQYTTCAKCTDRQDAAGSANVHRRFRR